ncbi:IS110 family transposase [Tuberibacillus sp. Marseille-P3662]|uniref:IS110 family transposase n=1 Tax=Tuberibacillus sp. Marseille-P3662 TaxID=1965358 RepID=UPI000A1C9B42|nr:IS110 family transposase [Tuberibacillus sp. Marseille-P3662]
MNPVIGLDVAKEESQVQAYLRRKKPYKKSFKFKHNIQGLEKFYTFYQEVEQASGKYPTVILESTGHYHEPVVQFLERNQMVYFLVNPIVSFGAKQTGMRKVKTDAVDAAHLCELYYKEDLVPFRKKSVQILNLRHLTRQHDALTDSYVEVKLKFQTVLDQLFPEYKKVFGSIYSTVSLQQLLDFPTPATVLAADIDELAKGIKAHCHTRSYTWAVQKAEQLQEAALRDPFQQALYQSPVISLKMYIKLLLEYQEHLSTLKEEIDAQAKEVDDYDLIRSIPGIGDKIAATILSEIGGIDRFHHPKKLVAFSGIDPRVHESGKFKATQNRMTKRGSSKLRQALYTAVLCGLRKSRNTKLIAFYQNKRDEGKPHKVVMGACMNKLIHWIFYMLKRKEAFVEA